MEIGCSCNIDGFPEFWSARTVTAKKSHKCCECNVEIKPGQQYDYVCGKWEDHLGTYKTCLTCARIRRDYGCALGGLRDDIWECLGVDYITGEMELAAE